MGKMLIRIRNKEVLEIDKNQREYVIAGTSENEILVHVRYGYMLDSRHKEVREAVLRALSCAVAGDYIELSVYDKSVKRVGAATFYELDTMENIRLAGVGFDVIYDPTTVYPSLK